MGLAGPAQIDLTISGSWAGLCRRSPPASFSCTTLPRNCKASISRLPSHPPAPACLAQGELHVSSFNASFAHGPDLDGSVSFPVHCTAPETCVVHFDVHSSEVSLAQLNQLANPALLSQPWYHRSCPGSKIATR